MIQTSHKAFGCHRVRYLLNHKSLEDGVLDNAGLEVHEMEPRGQQQNKAIGV